MSMHPVPIRDQIHVTLVATKKQEGLIIRPETVEEKLVTGKVVGVGSGRVTMNGGIVPLDILVGDEVKFNKNMATEISHDGQTIFVLREDNATFVLRASK